MSRLKLLTQSRLALVVQDQPQEQPMAPMVAALPLQRLPAQVAGAVDQITLEPDLVGQMVDLEGALLLETSQEEVLALETHQIPVHPKVIMGAMP